MNLNKKYSYKSLKRQSFVDVDAREFNHTDIVGSSFYQNEPYTDVFPSNITGVTFINCNLDNVEIPSGATVNNGTNKHIRTMNDGEYWIVGKDGKPVEPRDKERYVEFGLSIDPKNIPATPLAEPITFTNDPKRIEAAKIEALKNDTARLRQILIDAGELEARAG